MRLAISNIAWDVTEDEDVAALLRCHSVDAIDIAPTKYFPKPLQVEDAEIARVKQWWAKQGIEITGMQALLFGTIGLNIFAKAEVQSTMLEYFKAICRIGSGLGATRLVFGSPKNRDRTGLNDEQTHAIAIDFFRRLGDIAAAHKVLICLEPNPASYGCNFMTGSLETADIVTKVDHAAICMQLDTGASQVNHEDPASVLSANAKIIGHIHASEPGLLPLGEGGTDHYKMAAAITQVLPEHVVTIEMLATKDEAHLSSIERSLRVAIQHYRFAANDR